jgi:Dolichyl-phosphate-mannose-protein mannosyltransferase
MAGVTSVHDDRIRGRAVRWWLTVLLATTLAGRLLLAAFVGLGIDEAYTVATAKTFELSTFDHPPLAWWMARIGRVFGADNSVLVRLPFLLLFSLTTWFAYLAGRDLFNPRAGLFAAVTLNLAPVIGWTTGTFILPDGPLIAAMLGALACVVRALFGPEADAAKWWFLTGIAAGFACLSKLHGVFLFAGVGLFILTSPQHRHWIWQPWPYLAVLISAVMFTPVILWNMQHEWASFAFQAGRARVATLAIGNGLAAIGGQALFLAPWVWAAIVFSAGRAAWTGPADARAWLLFCLGLGPVAVFTALAFTGSKTLFHWAAPGYLFWCILVGRDLDRDSAAGQPRAMRWLKSSLVAIGSILAIVLVISRLSWPPTALLAKVPYPLDETVSWAPLRTELLKRGLDRDASYVAAVRWHEAGRLGVALDGSLEVRCLCEDARSFGVLYGNQPPPGKVALIISPNLSLETTKDLLGTSFKHIAQLEPVIIRQGGKPLHRLNVYRAAP